MVIADCGITQDLVQQPAHQAEWPARDTRNCQRIIIISENPKNKKSSAVMPYWMPMTLWSVEKMYFCQKPEFLDDVPHGPRRAGAA